MDVTWMRMIVRAMLTPWEELWGPRRGFPSTWWVFLASLLTNFTSGTICWPYIRFGSSTSRVGLCDHKCSITQGLYLGLYSLNGKTARSHEVSKPRDSGLDFSNRPDIGQAPRLYCCRDACLMSVRYDQYNIQSRVLETSRDPTVRPPSALWIEALKSIFLVSWCDVVHVQGMAVTKAPLVNFSVTEKFDLAKV